MRIRTKLVIILLLVSLPPLVTVALIAGSIARQALEQRIGDDSLRFAKLAVLRVNEYLDRKWGNVRRWSALDEFASVAEGDRDGALVDLLGHLQEHRGEFSYLVCADRDGHIVAASDRNLLNKRLDESPGFRNALNGKADLQDVAYDDWAQGYTLKFTAPIWNRADRSVVVGVLSCALDWENVSEMVHDLRVRGTRQGLADHIMLLRRDGLVISCLNSNDMFKNNLIELGMPSALAAQRGEEGYIAETSEHGLSSLSAYTQWESYKDLPNPGWIVVLLQDADALFSSVSTLRLAVLWTALGTIVCVVVGSLMIAHAISKPVLAVASVANEIRSGDRSKRVAVERADEIGVLASSFNAMVAELEQAEHRLLRLAMITEQVGEGVAVADLEGNLQFVNAAWARMHGFENPDEVVGRPLSAFRVDESAVTREAGWPEEVGRLGRHTCEIEHVRSDGTRFPTQMTTTLLRDGEGDPIGLICCTTDITERKRDEQEMKRLSTAVQQAAEAIVITDADGTILFVNPAFERTSGYGRSEVIGQNSRLLASGVHDQTFFEELWESISSGTTWSGRFVNRRKDGTLYHEDTTISPICDPDGHITNYVAVKRDVTQEVALQTRLRHAQKMEAIGTLAAGVAHDFNNVLTAILGYASLAKQAIPEGHRASRMLDMVEKSAEKASDVTRSLLTFSRDVSIVKKPVNLAAVTVDFLRLLRRLLPESIEIVEEPSTDSEVWVYGDAGQLEQLLMNLALNARDSMPDGGRVRIALRCQSAEDCDGAGPAEDSCDLTAVLLVQDSGTGMSEEVQSRLFEPFYTTKERERGTGLGMSVVHGIVSEHRGRIEVESTPGEGTCVAVFLPCCAAPVPAARERDPHGGCVGHGEVIVLVEDDGHIRSLMTTVLRSEGFQLVQARNGHDALAAIDTHGDHLALIVMDLDLPQRDGLSFVRAIGEKHPRIPVLLITGHEGLDVAPAASRRQADGSALEEYGRVLHKPFRLSELTSTVVELLATHAERKVAAK